MRPTVTRRALAVVVVLAALCSVGGCGSGSGSDGGTATNSPSGVAERWADATLHDHDRAASLQCRSEIHTEIGLIPMTVDKLSGFHAVGSTHPSAGTWKVTLQTEPSKGGTTFGVTVVRQGGAYRVCD